MVTLESALETFNRKERNLLVRAMLSEEEHPPLPRLSKRFRKLVGDKVGLQIPDGTWWATDYHISWIAGALAIFINDDEEARGGPWRNSTNENEDRKLVERNQEDVDLILATGSDLILIEAKAYGTFTNSQLEHKFARLQLVYDFYKKELEGKVAGSKEVRFHFLVISPAQPTSRLGARGPAWACKDESLPWIRLDLPKGRIFLVTQCDEKKKSIDAGQYWCIKPITTMTLPDGYFRVRDPN